MDLAVKFVALNKAVDALTDQLKAAVDFADGAQKQSLALGLTFREASNTLGPSIQGLQGSIDQRFGAGLRALEAGLQGNTKGVTTLINQQQLTGTEFRKTADVFAKTNAILGLTNEANNQLSISLIQTGNKYGISTDKLVNAIDSLSEAFPAAALAGMGENLLGAVTQLQAELGPQLEGPLNQVMRMVMDTSMEGYERLVKLGIGGVREQLSAARSAAEAQVILKDAFITASKSFKDMAGDTRQFFAQTSVANETLGQSTINFVTVAEAFGKRVAKEGEQAADFGATLNTIKNNILFPLQAALMAVYPPLIEGLKAAEGSIRKFVEEGVVFALNGLDIFFNSIKDNITNFKVQFPEFMFSVKEAFHYSLIVPLNAVKIAFLTFKQGISVLLLGVTGLVEAFLGVANSFGDFEKELTYMQKFNRALIDEMEATAQDTKKALGVVFTAPERDKAVASFEETLEDPNLLGNRLRASISSKLDESYRVQQETNENLKQINDNTSTPATLPAYLDETVNTIGRSLERIIGVQGDNTSAEILEELRMQTTMLVPAKRTLGPPEPDSLS